MQRFLRGKRLRLQPVGEFLPELRDFWCDYHLTIGLMAVLLKVLLIVVLGHVENFRRHDFGDDGITPDFGRGEFANNRFGSRFLLG